MQSIADNKWSEQKEELFENKTKNGQPRGKTSEVKNTFQECAWKLSQNHYPKIYE